MGWISGWRLVGCGCDDCLRDGKGLDVCRENIILAAETYIFSVLSVYYATRGNFKLSNCDLKRPDNSAPLE